MMGEQTRTNEDRPQGQRVPLDKAQGALLGLAAGDALGLPQEGSWQLRTGARDAAPKIRFRRWTQQSGGSFHGFEEVIEPGEYSDDTQLMLAVARSRCEHGRHWRQALTDWELPFWLLYERGGGGATKRAARAWGAGIPPWRLTNSEDLRWYFNAGGNGVAMRVLPHALFLADDESPDQMLADVARDGIATHGHPRALVGAMAYAAAARWLVRHEGTVSFGALPKALLDESDSWGGFPEAALNDQGNEGWLTAAGRATGRSYEETWRQTVDEMRTLLDAADRGAMKGVLADDRSVLQELGCFGREGGAGTASAAAAVYLITRHAAQPRAALTRAAFERGADTDTIAAMTGGLAGCLAGVDWLPPAWHEVQDAEYLRKMADRVAAGPSAAQDAPVQRFARTKDDLIFLARDGNGEFPLGPLRLKGTALPDPSPHAKSIRVRRFQFRTSEGWTLYLNKIERVAPHTRKALLGGWLGNKPSSSD